MTTKPFATTERLAGSAFVGVVMGDGGEWAFEAADSKWVADSIADRINEAVDQREAKLRNATIAEAIRIAREAWEYHNDPSTEQRDGFGDGARGVALRICERLAKLSPEAAEFVPVATLDAANAKLREYAAVIDVIDTTEREPFTTEAQKSAVVEVAMRYLEANGLKAPKPVAVRLAGVKGGKVTAMAMAAVEALRDERDRTRPPRGEHARPHSAERVAFNRWEGEQAAFGMVLAVLRGHAPGDVDGLY